MSGGASMMWDIDPVWAKPEFVRPVMRTFIKQGGHIFQGNVTSVKELIEAQKNPDGHEDLMVRVGGFSARFCNLDKNLQNEIISRYRYGK
jgi:formate C-acetyltransferase